MKFNSILVNSLLGLFITSVNSAYDYNTSNVCDSGSVGYSQSQVAYMCNHQALGSCNLKQAAVADGFDSFAEYGFGGFGSNPQNSCCRCFQVQITDSSAPTKDLIVQGINTGGDVNGGQIDLSMIAGGFGANNGCANKVYAWNGGQWDGRAGPAQYPTSKAGDWCSDPTGDNTQCQNSYSGGIRNRADCSKLPTADLVSLCQYSFDTNWRIPSQGLRNTLMKEIRCPAGLRQLSGCDRDDASLPNPTGKLSASDPLVTHGTLTTMWDCCKPSCSWTPNVTNAKGTAVMSCDASGNVLGLGTPMTCQTFTCDTSCKSCSASNDSTKCTSCNNGYYLSANPGSCLICPSGLNCLTCTNSTTCTTCKTGYILQNDGSCALPCDSSCASCSTPQSSTSCTSCPTGSYLNGTTVGSCLACPPSLNCNNCASATTCNTCDPNYTLQADKTCLAGCNSSCKTCSTPLDATQCTSCNSGYYLNGSTVGTCVQCPSNCSACTGSNSCTNCINNTILINGVCQACTSPCSTCQTTITTCTSCISGYQLNGDNTCTQQNSGSCHSSCVTCSRPNDQNACTSCPSGKLVLGGNCQPCQPVCAECSGNPNSCTACPVNFKLSGNSCVGDNQDQSKCHSSCKTCSVQNDQNACTSCFDGFLILGNGNCQPCQPPCKNCQGNPNTCSECPVNYKLSGNTCVGDNQDQTQCHSSCKTCSVQNDQNACTSCFDGFLILGNGNCQPCQPPCKNCQGNPNTCSECPVNYKLSGDTCIGDNQDQTQCHSSCKTCSVQNDQNACTTCFDGFLILGNGNCQPCQPQCKTCSGDPNSCTACAAGYGMQNGRCVQAISDNSQCFSTCTTCNQPNNQNACITCSDGFVLASDNSCQPCKSPCQNCSGSQSSCTSCIANYVLTDSSCQSESSFNSVVKAAANGTTSPSTKLFGFSLFALVAVLMMNI